MNIVTPLCLVIFKEGSCIQGSHVMVVMVQSVEPVTSAVGVQIMTCAQLVKSRESILITKWPQSGVHKVWNYKDNKTNEIHYFPSPSFLILPLFSSSISSLLSDVGLHHTRVKCDGCEGPIYGTRYKCIVCPDYDLCWECKERGLHLEHKMAAIKTPQGDISGAQKIYSILE